MYRQWTIVVDPLYTITLIVSFDVKNSIHHEKLLSTFLHSLNGIFGWFQSLLLNASIR